MNYLLKFAIIYLMEIDTKHFAEILETEKKRLEGELSQIAHKNPDVPGDWEPSGVDLNPLVADKNEMADTFEELENRRGIENVLENRFKDITAALEKIKKGNYGLCENDQKPIDLKRLEANPAAKTCLEHSQ